MMPMPTYPDPYDTALPQCSRSMPSPRDDEQSHRRRRRKHDPDRERERERRGVERERERDGHRDRDRDANGSNERLQSAQKQKSSSTSKLPQTKRRSDSRERHRERGSPRSSVSERASDRSSAKKISMVVPEMDRRPTGEVRPAISYPNFSKAHSREAVGSREDVNNAPTATASPFTPDATELGKEDVRRRHSSAAASNTTTSTATPAAPVPPGRTPPSPPLTAEEPDIRRSGSGRSMRDTASDATKATQESRRRSTEGSSPSRGHAMKSERSGISLRKDAARYVGSELSSMPGTFPDDEGGKSTPNSSYRRTVSTTSHQHSTLTEDTTDSDATSIAPDRKSHRPLHIVTVPQSSSPSLSDPQPKTPVQEHIPVHHGRATPVIDVGAANKTKLPSFATPTTAKQIPPPPPPPPPPTQPKHIPRVDYLLKNGGLSNPVPKRLVTSNAPAPVMPYSVYQSPALSQAAPLEEYARVFHAIHKRLDDFLFVMNNNGSLAVATGYKSVARRLLDKLSQVFARDISSQRCDCVVCKTMPQPHLSDEEDSGVSWGEILEFVSGRRELPQWPPFTITPDDGGLGIFGSTQAPMQKLDIDVPDEYRDHYIRQNQKTKRAVQNWLAQQPEYPSSPPDEADEDTLMFAMMTKLTVQQRNLFIALMHGQSFISESRAPTPAERPAAASNALRRAKEALQRLYRLDRPPRDCEAAMYMLNNPHLHGMLATLAEVNEAEWEILISGRFDGFLWSGAEAPFPPSASYAPSPIASRAPSRGLNATPFSRTTTPFSGISAMSPSRSHTPFSPFSPMAHIMSPDGFTGRGAFPGTGGGPSGMFPSRGPTPAPNGTGMNGVSAPGPVQLDEDTEIAVAAELERNLFIDMERLEDAFEILHGRAELVSQMLRERSAGLSAQAQLRRGGPGGFGQHATHDVVGVRLDTPASGITDIEEAEEDDDGLADLASLAPDDSASQISVNRRYHRMQRRERRTPAPPAVEILPEEDESVFEEHDRSERRREKGGRRSKY